MSRKYKQRGYQDEEIRDSPKGREGGSVRRDGPGGRGLGAPNEQSVKCGRCGARVRDRIDMETVCAGCGSDLHTCTNCRHFDTSARFECREPIEERVVGKSRRNSCDRFASRLVHGFSSDSDGVSDDPKAAFDALFDL